MTSKHTQDTPWRTFKGVEDEPDRWTVVSDYGYLIATIENGSPGDTLDTEEANATLIAAAPTMIEALTEAEAGLECAIAIIKQHDADWDKSSPRLALDIVKSAIQRATGGDER